MIPYLVLDRSDISLGSPVHSSREVSEGGRIEHLAWLPVGPHAVAIVHLCKLSTILQVHESLV